MDWIEHLNQAMAFIEEHLMEELDYEDIADIAGCPPYYFQKVFLYMTNVTLNEYIRRRRLSLAAVELQKNNGRVIDVSAKFGYESPTAFNRAFKNFHGVAPSALRTQEVSFKAYPPVRFSLSIQGGWELNFRIEEKEAFCILGVSCPLDKDLEKNFATIPNAWNQALADGTLMKLGSLMNGKPQGLLGVSVCHTEEWKYFIAVSSDEKSGDFEEYEIPSCKWAVFAGTGTNVSLQDLERRVLIEWLPTSGYKYADIPDIEVYIKADPQDAVYEYWLPVV